MRELAIVCPAGEPVAETREGGPGCRCRIERSTLRLTEDARLTPSVLAYCSSGYTGCPTWRARRDAWLEDQHRDMERDVLSGVGRSEE